LIIILQGYLSIYYKEFLGVLLCRIISLTGYDEFINFEDIMNIFATKINRNIKKLNSGTNLIEVTVVIAIIAILVSLAVLGFTFYVEKAKKEVCNANCIQLEKMYHTYLIMEEKENSEIAFSQYLKEYDKKICPGRGEVNYVDGKIQCSVHARNEDGESNDEDEEEVPFL
jgi:competence protein ComGC